MAEVKDVMRRNYPYVKRADCIKVAARKMSEAQMSFLPVCEKGRFRGVVREKEILTLIAAGKRSAERMYVKSVVDTQYPKVSPGQDLSDVAHIMARRHVEELPVVQNGRLLGIVTLDDMTQVSPMFVVLAKAANEAGLPKWQGRDAALVRS